MATLCALSASVCRADLVFHVSLNTAPLIGHPAGPFSLAFDLIDGDGAVNNTVTVSNFLFVGTGAGPTGSPTTMGGAAGDLSSTVTLNDTAFFNSLSQEFSPGSAPPSRVEFDVQMTTNFAGGTPDSFAFSILDNSGLPIPTQDPLGTDTLLSVDINSSNPSIQTFATDPNEPPQGGGNPIQMSAPVVQVVPEPLTVTLLIVGIVGWVIARKWRRGS